MSKPTAPDARLTWAACAAMTAGLLGFNALPFLVGATIDHLELSATDAGILGSVEIGAMAAVSFLVAPFVARLSARRLGLLGGALTLIGCGASAVTADFRLLLAARAIAGVGEGLVYATANSTIASSPRPERLYARATLVMALAAASLFVLLPWAIERAGATGGYALIAVMALGSLPLLALLPDRPVRESEVSGAGWGGAAAMVVIGAFVLSNGLTVLWTFVERLGRLAGLTAGAVGLVLAVTTVTGISGAALAEWVGDRWGRLRPLAIGCVALALASLAVSMGARPSFFVAGELVYNAAYLFVMPFVLALAAAVDPTGRLSAATGGAIMAGSATGPGFAGLVVEQLDYTSIGWVVAAHCALALTILAVPPLPRSAGSPRLSR